ncbi:MAG: hypothetical protein WDZ77_03075 [Candidatus Pacearchaeota archaeon]
MLLSAVRILELNKKHNLLENLCKRESENPEGVGIDLRGGKVYKIEGDSFLGADEHPITKEKLEGLRHSPKVSLVANYEDNKERVSKFTIKPGEYYLIETIEKVHSPAEKVKYDDFFPEGYLVPVISPRVSLQKGAVALYHARTNPGYSGPLIFGLANNGKEDFTFELGARMFRIDFEGVIGDIDRIYSGQHQGGRVTSQGEKEKQN